MASAARQVAVSRAGAASLAAALLAGLVIVGFSVLWLGASPLPPLTGSVLIGLGLLIAMRRPLATRFAAMRARMAPATAQTPAASAAPVPRADPKAEASVPVEQEASDPGSVDDDR
jgi:hypothetical protein